jgi:hypothetical protein
MAMAKAENQHISMKERRGARKMAARKWQRGMAWRKIMKAKYERKRNTMTKKEESIKEIMAWRNNESRAES